MKSHRFFGGIFSKLFLLEYQKRDRRYDILITEILVYNYNLDTSLYCLDAGYKVIPAYSVLAAAALCNIADTVVAAGVKCRAVALESAICVL